MGASQWCRSYCRDGVAGLVDKRLGGNRALLRPEQIEELQRLLHSYTPGQRLGGEAWAGDGQFWTVPDLATVVARHYGVVYQSRTSYYRLFAQCDFSRQRPGSQYRSRSER